MKKLIILLLCCSCLSTSAQGLYNRQKTAKINGTLYLVNKGFQYQVDTTMVTVKKLSPETTLNSEIKVIKENKLGYIDIQVPKGKDVEKFVEELKHTKTFESVEYVGYCQACLSSNDSLYGSQYYLDRILADRAWDITTGNSSIKVAIIDSGVDAGHPDLGYGSDTYTHVDTSNGWDYINNNSYTTPVYKHGTAVAGVLGAKTNNSIGIAGVCGGNHSAGITIVPYCVVNSENSSTGYVDDAIIDAVDSGVKIIVFAFTMEFSNNVNAAIEYAYNHGVSVVCPTGNDSYTYIGYPASHEKTIAVGALADNNYRKSDSCYGEGIDLVAPGENIYTTDLNNSYFSATGTSVAVPQVAATIALMLSVNPSLTPSQIRNILISTTTRNYAYSYNNNGWNEEVGYGRLNVHRAVVKACSYGWSINGASEIYNSAAYQVSNLQYPLSIIWSLSGTNASCYSLQNDKPTTNQCTITKRDSVDFVNTNDLVLTAHVMHNGEEVSRISKSLTAVCISGPTIPCSQETYQVENLPSGCTINWTWAGSGLTVDSIPILVEPYYSTNNYLKLNRSNLSYAKGVITANIQQSGATIGTLTKTIDTGAYFYGTWYQGSATASTLACGASYNITDGSSVVLQSADFMDATATYTSNDLLLLGGLSHSGNTISFTPIAPLMNPTGLNAIGPDGLGNSVTIHVKNTTTCETFKFTFTILTHPTSGTLNLNINSSGSEYTFSLDDSQPGESNYRASATEILGDGQTWNLEIVELESGEAVYNEQSEKRSITVNMSSQKSGIYVVVARIGNKTVATQKIAITNQ